MLLKKTVQSGSSPVRRVRQIAHRRRRVLAVVAGIGLVSLASARWHRENPIHDEQFGSLASGQGNQEQTATIPVALVDITASVGLPGSLKDVLVASNDDGAAGLVDLHILQLVEPLEVVPAAQILDSLQAGPPSETQAFAAELCRLLELVQEDSRGPDLSCGWRLMYERLAPEQQETDYSVLTDLNAEPGGTADEHTNTAYRQVRSVLERLLPPTSPQLQVYRLILNGGDVDIVYTVLYAPPKGHLALLRYRTASFDAQPSGTRPPYREWESQLARQAKTF